MSRRSSIRLSLKKSIRMTQEPDTEPVEKHKQKRRWSEGIPSKCTEESNIEPVEKKNWRLSRGAPVNYTEEPIIHPVKKKNRRLSGAVPSNYTEDFSSSVEKHKQKRRWSEGIPSKCTEESNIEPVEKKNRRLSRGAPVNYTEEPVIHPVKKKNRRLSGAVPSNYTEDFSSSEENIQPVDKSNRRSTSRKSVKKSVDSNDLTQIQNYYLDKTVKKKTTALETIFEDSEKLMGRQKLRRFICFEEKNKQKVKKYYQCLRKLSSRKMKSIDAALGNLDIVDVD